MGYVIGVALAVAVGVFGWALGYDRERSFYSVSLIVIGTLYILFAAIGGSTDAMIAEALPALLFVTAAAVGFRKSQWVVVGGLALHGVFDFVHPAMIHNPGVPAWWPAFCLAYDVTAAIYLAVLIRVRGVPHAVA